MMEEPPDFASADDVRHSDGPRPTRWRLGTRNPFTVYRVADGAHDVDHAREHFVCSFRREEDARLAVDAVNAQAAHDGYTCQSADSDLESAQGELNEARLWLARRGVEVKTHRSLTWALNGAERAGVVGGPADPAGSAVGQRGAPTRDDLVEAFQDAECVLNRSYPVIEAPWRPVNDSEAEKLADVALAALRDGGADGGGEDVAPASSAERLRRAADALAARAGEWYGSAAVADGINKLVYEARRVVAEPWVPRADGYELCNEPHPDGKHRPCVKTQGHNVHRDGRGDFWESLRTTPDEADIARLATALGVSLDPDDPDPVGRLEAAAGKAREVEVVSGAVAAELPDGSVIAPCGPTGVPHPFDGVALFVGQLDGRHRAAVRELDRVRVLYRAPAPAPAALAVGEVVTGDRAVDAPVGTKLGAQNAAVAAVHTTDGWSVTGMNYEQDHEHAVRINEWVVLALGGES